MIGPSFLRHGSRLHPPTCSVLLPWSNKKKHFSGILSGKLTDDMSTHLVYNGEVGKLTLLECDVDHCSNMPHCPYYNQTENNEGDCFYDDGNGSVWHNPAQALPHRARAGQWELWACLFSLRPDYQPAIRP